MAIFGRDSRPYCSILSGKFGYWSLVCVWLFGMSFASVRGGGRVGKNSYWANVSCMQYTIVRKFVNKKVLFSDGLGVL